MKLTSLQVENLSSPVAIDSLFPRFSWKINGEGACDVRQMSYRILVATTPEHLEKKIGDVWNSKTVRSGKSVLIPFEGKTLKSMQIYYWIVTVRTSSGQVITSKIGSFRMGLLNESDWGCGFIGLDSSYLEMIEEAKEKAGLPSPYLRRTFTIKKDVKSAAIYATSLGLYEIRLNGKRVGRYEFTPGWTDYNKSLQYQGYDVTDLLGKGNNAIGAILGDGWFCGNIAIVGRKQYGDYPLGLMAHLEISYMDGTTESIVTDQSWKAASGPILYNDNQTGEFYDARKELPDFDSPSYDDSGWFGVTEVKKSAECRLKANIGPQVEVVRTLNAKSLTTDQNGKYIYDLGQNMVGRISFRLKVKEGEKITFRFGEMLNENGTLYTENLRSASQTDIYIAKGAESECFELKFTFHGFRYVEVSGLTCQPSLEDITGIVISSNCEQIGEIQTSETLVNQLFSNQLWGQRGNFLSVPTDCPQRDERMGWTGDAQVFAGTACYNMNCAGFYEKYIEDCLEAQKQNGAITDVVPCVRCQDGNDLVGNGNAAWGDVIFVLPWTTYQMYGDIRILENSYSAMCKYLSCLETTTDGYLRPDFGYGDWLSIEDDTPKDVMSTAFFAYAALLTAKTAKILGKKEEAVEYKKLFYTIKKAFNKAYVSMDGTIKGDTQCCYLLVLKFELVSPSKKELTVKHLIRTIERKSWHLSTGFVGVSYLLPVLSEYGHNDVAYRLLLNDTYPSWGYSIKNGATTIWERWNSYTKENGFGDVGMNSFNHYSLGSVGEWMYRYMGGIIPLKPGFKQIKLKPYIDKRLNFADVSYQCVYGTIKSSWKYEGNKVHYQIEIPANTSAVIYLQGREVQCTKGNVIFSEKDHEVQSFITGSGVYCFTAEIPTLSTI